MTYKKAEHILPIELIQQIQEYVDGEYIYIPRKKENKKGWGANTSFVKEITIRNEFIYKDFLSGNSIVLLSKKYFLSSKSIERIVYKMKKEKGFR